MLVVLVVREEPVLALYCLAPSKVATGSIFNTFGMARLGFELATFSCETLLPYNTHMFHITQLRSLLVEKRLNE